ncbi:MAG: sulfatase, partial [Planctomycetota bacterium]
RSNTRVSAIDIAPTLLQAVGAPIPKEMVGLNLLDAEAVKSRKAVFGECFFHDAVDLDNPAANLRWRWVIEGPWRLVVPSANEPKAVVELYNLDDDLDERTNLAAREPERVRRLQALLDDWWPGTSKEPRTK